MSVFLFVPFYLDSLTARKEEILLCLKNNISNFVFEKIFLVSEQDNTIFNHPKLRYIKMEKRPTYSDVFSLAREVNPDGINFVFNADIYMKPIDVLKAVKLIDENILESELVLALSRWDITIEGDYKHYCKKDSQDSWIFKGGLTPHLKADFHFGKPGCDNRIAYELMRQDYLVINPSKEIKSFHIHKSQVRNYSEIDRIPPPYFYPIIV